MVLRVNSTFQRSANTNSPMAALQDKRRFTCSRTGTYCSALLTVASQHSGSLHGRTSAWKLRYRCLCMSSLYTSQPGLCLSVCLFCLPACLPVDLMCTLYKIGTAAGSNGLHVCPIFTCATPLYEQSLSGKELNTWFGLATRDLLLAQSL